MSKTRSSNGIWVSRIFFATLNRCCSSLFFPPVPTIDGAISLLPFLRLQPSHVPSSSLSSAFSAWLCTAVTELILWHSSQLCHVGMGTLDRWSWTWYVPQVQPDENSIAALFAFRYSRRERRRGKEERGRRVGKQYTKRSYHFYQSCMLMILHIQAVSELKWRFLSLGRWMSSQNLYSSSKSLYEQLLLIICSGRGGALFMGLSVSTSCPEFFRVVSLIFRQFLFVVQFCVPKWIFFDILIVALSV